MSDTIRINDLTPHDELAEAMEARSRRLMAELARLPLTWQTRARRRELEREVNESLDEFNATVRA
jgi:hypothetical protein